MNYISLYYFNKISLKFFFTYFHFKIFLLFSFEIQSNLIVMMHLKVSQ